jgi:hypothetical protein
MFARLHHAADDNCCDGERPGTCAEETRGYVVKVVDAKKRYAVM